MADLLYYFQRSRSISRLPHVSFPFLRFPPPSYRCSRLSSLTLPVRFALLDPTSLRRGRLDRRITLTLPSHATLRECDVELGIVTVSDAGGPVAQIPRDDQVRVLPYCASRRITRPHWDQNERSGLEGP
jgi:hypothetical protein